MAQAVYACGICFFLGCCALAIGYANSGPNQFEIKAMGRRDAAVELAKRGATPLIVSCILDPPTFSYYCVDALKSPKCCANGG